MIHIFHHIHPYGIGKEISLQQKDKIYKNILEPFNYIPNEVSENETELNTLKFLQEKIKSLNDDDYILYIHTKSSTNFLSYGF